MNTGARPRVALTGRMVATLSVFMAVVLILLSWIVQVWIRDRNMGSVFSSEGRATWEQALAGLVVGLLASVLVSIVVIKLRMLDGFRAMARRVLQELRPTLGLMLLVSVLAGFSEELFFRAVIQPMWGLFPAALLFALVHVGIPRSKGRVAFAGFVALMGALLGLLYESVGLLAAMTAHASYDLGFLLIVRQRLIGPS